MPHLATLSAANEYGTIADLMAALDVGRKTVLNMYNQRMFRAQVFHGPKQDRMRIPVSEIERLVREMAPKFAGEGENQD